MCSKKLFTVRSLFFVGERALAGPVQELCDRRSTGQISEPRGTPGLKVEPTKVSQQLVYVFTTSLANRYDISYSK